MPHTPLIPAHSRPKDGVLSHAYAGIQGQQHQCNEFWIPAFAGMSGREGMPATHFPNLLPPASGTGCDLSLPFSSRITQTRFSEHSTHVSPLRPNRCSTSKLERPKVIILSTVTSSPNRVGF